jgi:hypothetical protein
VEEAGERLVMLGTGLFEGGDDELAPPPQESRTATVSATKIEAVKRRGVIALGSAGCFSVNMVDFLLI